MTIAVLADENQWDELREGTTEVEWVRVQSVNEFAAQHDACFILNTDIDISLLKTDRPVFLNAVKETLQFLKLPSNVLRFNGWNGFLSKMNWEIAGVINASVTAVLSAIKRQFTVVKDEPGFVSARVIAMIINEAYFALDEGVSTKSEIDIAMKLGTNYPFGPFEWSDKIGIDNVYQLLQQLAVTDKRYTPSTLLQKEAVI